MEPADLGLFLIFIVILGGAVYLIFNYEELTRQVTELDETLSGETKKNFDRIEEDGLIKFSYSWQFKKKTWNFEGAIQREKYDALRDDGKTDSNYWLYVSDRRDDEDLATLITLFRESAEDERFDPYETVNFVISFVQSMPYTSDKVTTGYDEYRRYPIETLVDGGGDCEDSSILTAALLQEMGYGVVLLSFEDHIAVGVLGSEELKGKRYVFGNGIYYYLETTGEGWEIGEIPDEYKDLEPEIIEVEAKPLLSLSWASTPVTVMENYTGYRVDVEVVNDGTEDAENCEVTVFFESKTGEPYSEEKVRQRVIGAGESRTIPVSIGVARGVETMISVRLDCDNSHPLEKSSSWSTS